VASGDNRCYQANRTQNAVRILVVSRANRKLFRASSPVLASSPFHQIGNDKRARSHQKREKRGNYDQIHRGCEGYQWEQRRCRF
jgi:hypothetical protein